MLKRCTASTLRSLTDFAGTRALFGPVNFQQYSSEELVNSYQQKKDEPGLGTGSRDRAVKYDSAIKRKILVRPAID